MVVVLYNTGQRKDQEVTKAFKMSVSSQTKLNLTSTK